MPTPSEIDRQVKFEREAIRHGLEKLHKNIKDLEKKSYASASVYGCSSINALLQELLQALIDATKDAIDPSWHQWCHVREIKEYLDPIDTRTAAAIALKLTFDKVFSVTR